MSKSKYTPELKIALVKKYLSGEGSYESLAKANKISDKSLRRWVLRYQVQGKESFSYDSCSKRYSKEFKEQCVEAYLSGEGSLEEIAIKQGISSVSIFHRWIMRYNANMELKDHDPKREVYMASARRKTTLDERKVIAEYCIAHDKDYKGTATLYSVSYSQVYDWVRKYLSEGEEGLTDKRGHHKADAEVDELERLRRENQRLKRQLEDEKRTVALLKKVNELEGM